MVLRARSRWAPALVAALVVLTGCGDDDGGDARPGDGPASTSTSAPSGSGDDTPEITVDY